MGPIWYLIMQFAFNESLLKLIPQSYPARNYFMLLKQRSILLCLYLNHVSVLDGKSVRIKSATPLVAVRVTSRAL